MLFSVVYEYRADSGMAYATPTNADRATIETEEGERDAARLAIDHAYQSHENISHVRILRITPIIKGE